MSLSLALVETPVEQLRDGDVIVLPNGRRVEVQRIDRHDDGRITVRWHAGPLYPHRHALAGQRRDLGSLVPKQPGTLVLAEREVTLEEVTL